MDNTGTKIGGAIADRRNAWIETISGRRFPFVNTKPEDVSLEDIIHALAYLPRFNGHTDVPYSVGQHTLFCLSHAEGHYAEVLVHDFAEAYIGDITSPLKSILPDFRAIEERVQRAIRVHFGLPPGVPVEAEAEVRRVDLLALSSENEALRPHTQTWDIELPPPVKITEAFVLTPPYGVRKLLKDYCNIFLPNERAKPCESLESKLSASAEPEIRL
jgi:hypothetical protein